jgi:hypothetical protein
MTRHEKLLLGLDLGQATAIEIGALDKPLLPPASPGAFFVDHLDTPSLREKYAAHDFNLDNLVHVDGVWGERSLAEAAAPVAPVDCVVASHVIEHVPDRRYTFDLLRAETVLADVLAAHLVRARIPQVRQMIDHVANIARVNCHQLWEGTFDRTALVKLRAQVARLERAVDEIKRSTSWRITAPMRALKGVLNGAPL